MALALYRKYRPLRFADVTGQPHIVRTLQAQTASDKLSHAYLFTGSRGTGKTSCAKILARAACCAHPENGDPCNQCPACLSILDGSTLDMQEIDAASNSGVNNIRLLQDELIYAPVSLKKRVFIIDEVHMLSQSAFNALLKTLEEPPDHVLFILATTETHKVPATILSRCQRFAFRRISPADIRARLHHVAREEGLTVSPEALSLIARAAEGGLRDALSLLDQCAAVSANVDESICRDALGLLGLDEMAAWLTEIGEGRIEDALQRLDAMFDAGRDFAALLDELSSFARDVLMASIGGGEPVAEFAPLLPLWQKDRLLFFLKELVETRARMARGLLKRPLCELFLFTVSGNIVTPPASTAVHSQPPTPPPPPLQPTPPPAQPQSVAPPAQPTPPPQPVTPVAFDKRWNTLLQNEPFLKKMTDGVLTAVEVTAAGDGLILQPTKPGGVAGVINNPLWKSKITAVFPGGVRIGTVNAPVVSAPQAMQPPPVPQPQRPQSQPDETARLAQFKAQMGDLLTEN